MVTTQPCWELGLVGYESKPLWTNISYAVPGGRETRYVQKWLTQLGCRSTTPVQLAGDGPILDIPSYMVKIKVKLGHQAQTTELTPLLLSGYLSLHVDNESFADILVQTERAATLWVHRSVMAQILQLSGAEHLYFKVHKESGLDSDLLWLGAGTSHEEAMDIAKRTEGAMGLACKGPATAVRYALRFFGDTEMATAATTLNIQHQLEQGRFKATGTPAVVGTAGLLDVLLALGWAEDTEIIYMGANTAVFLTTSCGKCRAQLRHSRGMEQLKIKAINAKARKMATEANKASAAAAAADGAASAAAKATAKAATSTSSSSSTAATTTTTERQLQQARLRAAGPVLPHTPRNKRPATEHTQQTPPAQAAKSAPEPPK